jgi:hypothetical protein
MTKVSSREKRQHRRPRTLWMGLSYPESKRRTISSNLNQADRKIRIWRVRRGNVERWFHFAVLLAHLESTSSAVKCKRFGRQEKVVAPSIRPAQEGRVHIGIPAWRHENPKSPHIYISEKHLLQWLQEKVSAMANYQLDGTNNEIYPRHENTEWGWWRNMRDRLPEK